MESGMLFELLDAIFEALAPDAAPADAVAHGRDGAATQTGTSNVTDTLAYLELLADTQRFKLNTAFFTGGQSQTIHHHFDRLDALIHAECERACAKADLLRRCLRVRQMYGCS